MKDLRTFIINEKKQPGGNSYKEYTWNEVLDYFEAPEELKDEDKRNDVFEPNYYDVVNQNHESLL